ncbi:MAG: hypothetical protein H7222_12560 [Methylotenera sp.]|nr:hypothetical protein [Oligoflexia bacterium]
MIRLTLFAVAGFFAWRNRFEIQRFLGSYGIKTPLLDSTLSDTVRSGAAKITGSVEHEARKMDNESRRAI